MDAREQFWQSNIVVQSANNGKANGNGGVSRSIRRNESAAPFIQKVNYQIASDLQSDIRMKRLLKCCQFRGLATQHPQSEDSIFQNHYYQKGPTIGHSCLPWSLIRGKNESERQFWQTTKR